METRPVNTSEKAGQAGFKPSGAQTVPVADIMPQFDGILGKHLDRLLGVRQGIETLPMNIFTVSCLILLATRETEIEGFPYLPPERYTRESLLNDMSEMNIEAGGDLEGYIKSMHDMGYIRVEIDGRLFPGSPIMKTAVLFDRIFPKMPGLTLVAYLGQMIDEVLSNRKPLNAALNQFDQMLSLQGMSLIKNGDSTQRDTMKAFPNLKVSETIQPVKKKIIAADIKPSDIYSKLQTKEWTAPQIKVETHTASSHKEQRSVAKGETLDLPIIPAAVTEIAVETLEVKDQHCETKALSGQEVAESQMGFSKEQYDSSNYDGYVSSSEKTASVRGYDQDFNSELEDDDIEKKIAAFEEELSMKCPLCRTGRIVPNKTAKGKPYYKCSSEECNFISWGKPYYIACPTCENPFLIETPDSQGNMMLKCPRTTCPHWQRFPWDLDEEHDIKSIVQEKSSGAIKKPRRLVRRRKRVVVRRKS